jgi:hypothetical protein
MQLRLLASNRHEANRQVLPGGLQRAFQIHFSHRPTLSPWSVGHLRPTLRGSTCKKHSQVIGASSPRRTSPRGTPRANVALRMPSRNRPSQQDRSRTHRLLQWLRTHRPGGQVPAGSPVHPPAIALPLLRVEYLSHVAHHCEACYTGARIYGGCAGEFQ